MNGQFIEELLCQAMLFCGLDCPIPLDINLEEFLPANLWVHEVANDLVNVPLLIDSRPLLELLELRGPNLLILGAEEERGDGHVLVPLVRLVQVPD